MTITERAERARDRATGRREHPVAVRLLIAGAAAAVGATIAFLADPARGRARRARLLDQGRAAARQGWRRVERAARGIESTAEGKLQALAEGGQRVAPVDDVTLRDRAETELFRDPKVPKGSINLSVERGILVLRGEVPNARMRNRLEREGASIDGVWSVHNLLHLPGETPEPVS
jgi:osmotically-inducible protein OsmY